MKIGVIQASSQINKNNQLYEYVRQYAIDHVVFNFGCFADEDGSYSYIEISILVGLLLNSGSIDFIVTGCSSGQGMMLACNTMPGVICGYVPTPMDAYLFAQINNGNAVSLPLGEQYTYTGQDNCRNTIKKLFSEPFGQGYPKEDVLRKKKDTELLKIMKSKTHIDFLSFLDELNGELIDKVLKKRNVIQYILESDSNSTISKWVRKR